MSKILFHINNEPDGKKSADQCDKQQTRQQYKLTGKSKEEEKN